MTKARVSKRNRAAIVLAAFSVVAAGEIASATTYTWNTTSGNWSSAANWIPNTGTPSTAGDSAQFTDTTADHTATYTTTGATSLGNISITQLSTHANTIDLQSAGSTTISASGTLTLGAANGGTSTLFLDPAGTNGLRNMIFIVPTININAGGVLELSSYDHSGVTEESTVNANISINGGTLFSDRAWSDGPATSSDANTINGNVTLAGGTLSIGVKQPGTGTSAKTLGGTIGSTVDRLNINGDFVATGGTIVSSVPTDVLFLLGKDNSIQLTNNAAISANINFGALTTTGQTQTLFSDSAFASGIQLRQTSATANFAATVKMGAVTTGGTLSTAQITFQNKAAGGTQTLQLTSNITTSAVPNQSGNADSVTDVLDTNGFAFQITANSIYSLSAGTHAVWDLENTNTSQAGSISAIGFNISGPASGTSVIGNLNLVATSGSQTNTLSNANGGTIDAASTFVYAPTTSISTASTLSSSRTIGSVAVQAGTLVLGTSLTTASTSTVSVAAGSTLSLNALTLSTGNLTVAGNITGATTSKLATTGTFTGTGTVGAAAGISSSGTFSAGTVGTVGTIALSSGVFTLGGTDRVDINDTSSFDQVALSGGSVALNGTTIDAEFASGPAVDGSLSTYQIFSGGVTGTFTLTSNLDSRYTVSFDQSTGTLSVTPEPTSFAMIGGAGMLLLRRRQRSRRIKGD